MYLWVILLFLYKADRVALQCENCAKCDGGPNGWSCSECKDNFYLSGNRCYLCPASCTKCTANTQCSRCNPYYYGSKCQYNCFGCSNGLCDQNSGVCSSGCKSGYYKEINDTCSMCRMTCKKCDDYYHCSECPEGKYLQQYVSGKTDCDSCPTRCSSCSNYTTCTQCKQSHHWGAYCQNNCEYCVNDCDEKDGCSTGCIDGYYKTDHVSKGWYECIKCPISCISCTDISHCQECKDGFYGEANAACNECSPNCRSPLHCNKSNGSCTNSCRDGWSGDKCDQACSSGCIRCERYNSSSCGICRLGLYGAKCETNCSQNCKTVDGEQVCNKSDGYCDHGCKDALWGHACEHDCGPGCNGSVCNRTSGVCTNGCTDEYYGVICNTQCSRHCKSSKNDSSGRSCNEKTGECLLGCDWLVWRYLQR